MLQPLWDNSEETRHLLNLEKDPRPEFKVNQSDLNNCQKNYEANGCKVEAQPVAIQSSHTISSFCVVELLVQCCAVIVQNLKLARKKNYF